MTILNRWWMWVWWNYATIASATTTYLLLTIKLFFGSLPNWLGTQWSQPVSTNQTMKAWFYNKSKQVMIVSLMELCNNSISKHHLPPTHTMDWFVRSVPNWLGTEWAQLVSTNQTMKAWFYNNSKQVMNVSLVELCNNSVSNHHIPPTHHQMFFWILTKL
jgi:hypothetical protein